MKPSPILLRRTKTRLPFTTKQVGKGFYRGTGTGSTGAHTVHGHYVIDWRKVRHFVVPNLSNFKLTPFVSADILPNLQRHEDPMGNVMPKKITGLDYLRWFKDLNLPVYEHQLSMEENKQAQELDADEETAEAEKQAPAQT